MERLRAGLGLLAGALLVLSSAAHSVLGWKELSGQLASARLPPELIFGVQVGWHFGGACMLAFGAIVLALFTSRLRGANVSPMPAVVIGATYLVFGTWALIASSFNPFFLVFVVPAVLLLGAAPGGRGAQG